MIDYIIDPRPRWILDILTYDILHNFYVTALYLCKSININYQGMPIPDTVHLLNLLTLDMDPLFSLLHLPLVIQEQLQPQIPMELLQLILCKVMMLLHLDMTNLQNPVENHQLLTQLIVSEGGLILAGQEPIHVLTYKIWFQD